MPFRLLICLLLLAGCSGGAVVFAPTPLPPDVSPLRYDHPSGAFSVMIPRQWSAAVQHTTALAAAAFTPPDGDDPAVRFAVLNLGQRVDSAALGDFISQYQAAARADGYTESGRQAMGDGSWRLSGLQHRPGGLAQPVNTFIQANGSFIGIIEVRLPDDAARLKELQLLVNTFDMQPDTPLEPASAAVLAYASGHRFDFVNVAVWKTPAALVISGEVANYGGDWAASVPLRAILRTSDGAPLLETAGTTLGYGIPPGGFAPFSLRFAQGQPSLAVTYDLLLGGDGWQPEPAGTLYGPDTLAWTDESSLNAAGQLVITGAVTNTGSAPVRQVRAVVTVFDAAQQVIAAGQGDVTPLLSAGESTSFQITLPEMGGSAAKYFLNLQGLP